MTCAPVVGPVGHDAVMSMGDGLLVQAFEAMGWPMPEVKRVAAALLLVSMVLFPVTFRHALMAYADMCGSGRWWTPWFRFLADRLRARFR
jgi:hypothetical protein